SVGRAVARRVAGRRGLAGMPAAAGGPCVAAGGDVARVVEAGKDDGKVRLVFEDGHASAFHPVWLLDHDPSTIHATSLQRQLDSAALDLDTPAPDSIEVQDQGQQVVLKWASRAEPLSLSASWLREHCYDDKARKERHEAAAAQRSFWKAADLPKSKVLRVDCQDVLRKDDTVVDLLQELVRTGVVIVSNMPSGSAETEEVVRRIGPPRETFYQAMWDTAPKDASQVNDTAYTKDGLDCHTDTSYLIDSAGLQLFNCVAQSDAVNPSGLNDEGEIEGATKLLDGFKVLDDMRREHPDVFKFFCETPLKWHCIEDGVHVRSWEPVVEFDPETDNFKRFRYNLYDLSPIDYLPHDKIPDYYKATKVINAYIRSPEYISYMRLEPGEMAIIDNGRVCHGRTAFQGFRNMVGCYVGRDDWLSTLRSLTGQRSLANDE
ncbi:Trimethyllysine dioxygenase, partial [Durusdinium trenchii]